MEHLKDFLKHKRLQIKDILNSYCIITEKIDGTAFQVSFDNNELVFSKRSYSLNTISKNHIDDFDLILNKNYLNAFKIISPYISKIMYDNNIKILNFEIFDDNKNSHIIHYNNRYKNNIVLLSGYYKDDTEIDKKDIIRISDILKVSVNNTIYTGILNNINELIDTDNITDEYIWDLIISNIEDEFLHDDIEGYVLQFYNGSNSIRTLKVQNPIFQKKLETHLLEEKEYRKYNFENIYDYIINIFKEYHIISHAPYDTYITKLLELYNVQIETNNEYTNILINIEKKLENNEILKRFSINKLPLIVYGISDHYVDTLKYPNIFKFILLTFRNTRVKRTLWCSADYQLNTLNPFIKELKNNVSESLKFVNTDKFFD